MSAPGGSAPLRQASQLVAERLGLHFPQERWKDLARGLETAGPELGLAASDDCARWLVSQDHLSARQLQTLASHLTVGETYFFRDAAAFEVVERELLPPLIAQRAAAGRTLRLWSAGCCTGEEAYSLAISCARALGDELKTWNVSVLASDLNPRFLAKGEAGVYSQWSFRSAPPWLLERWFSARPGGLYAIAPELQRLVHFSYLNLAEDAYPALANQTNALDLIFCRNVLMYFTPSHQRRVVAALHRCLVEGGLLVVGAAETSTALFPMFSVENTSGQVLYRKTSTPPPLPSWPAPQPPDEAAALGGAADLLPPARAPAPLCATPMPLAAPDPLAAARALADAGRLVEARAACQEVVAAGPANAAAHFLQAIICQELGQDDEAIAALGRVLFLDQDFILAHHALGSLYRRVGKGRESRRHLAIALRLLSARDRDELVSAADGITYGRLAESVRALEDCDP